ncbi:MAG: glycosyltransferase family A protein [Pseudomonadota bacterium]
MADTSPAQMLPMEDAISIGRTEAGEEVLSNSVSGDATLSICIPAYKDTADALLASLLRLKDVEQCTLLIYDDGSSDANLTKVLARQILRFPGPARLITADQNYGRSHARNRLISLAETDWILFLDADMRPDTDDFISRYLKAASNAQSPSLIPGGFSLKYANPTDETRLHAAQSLKSECINAETRANQPGRYVFTSNILVHRDILNNIRFDDRFQGWGWEDVDWGLRVARTYPVKHIENTATHLGLDRDGVLIDKYRQSGANFVLALAEHPEALKATPLYKAAKLISLLPGRSGLMSIARRAAKWRSLPIKLRLLALKLYRASVYAKEL